MKGEGLVCVGVPRERHLMPQFVDSRDLILYTLRKNDMFGGYIQAPGCRIDHNRNRICKMFLEDEREAEWLIQLDNDMTFPPDIGERLIKRGKEVIGGLYFSPEGIYDPMCYHLANVKPDMYGRPSQFWFSMRDTVYDFLLANNVPAINRSMVLDNPVGEACVPADGLGTGALMVHRSVLEALEPPWFEFLGLQGEDLRFCKRVKDELGIQPYVDMAVICGHLFPIPLGPTQFIRSFQTRGIHLTNYEPEHAADWVAEFFDIPKELAANNIAKFTPKMMADYWNQQPRETREDVMAFYEDEVVGTMYLYDLIKWNLGRAFTAFRRMLRPHHNLRVLEIGGGIGSVAIQMAFQDCEVVTVEPNNILRKFIEYRWEDTKSRVQPVDRYKSLEIVKELPKSGEFDLVIALDVFEHIHKDELPNLLKRIGKMVPQRGRIFHNYTWGQQDLYPFHFDHSKKWDKWLSAAGFFEFEPPLWSVKIRE